MNEGVEVEEVVEEEAEEKEEEEEGEEEEEEEEEEKTRVGKRDPDGGSERVRVLVSGERVSAVVSLSLSW